MIQQENVFTTFDFTDVELLEACKLTPLQRAFIQHQLGIAAQDKLALNFDPKNPEDFIQNDAYIKGQMYAYQFLITNADLNADALREKMMQDQATKQADSSNLFAPKPNPNQTLGEI